MNHILLLGFSDDAAADIRIQLGSAAPDTAIENMMRFDPGRLELDADTLVFLLDSPIAMGQVLQLFKGTPSANIVVLSMHADRERASGLMGAGVMDYRVMPCPDEVFGIYIRKTGHLAELSRQSCHHRQNNDIFITQDVETRRLLDRLALIAPSRASVLILGASGTGKEILARFIHQCSDRRKNAFVAINCAAIPEGILESELFGHEKGAFTGAACARTGKFELAHGGTLLLDEITEMPPLLQAKLLRVLQEGEVDRLGGKSPVKIDVRVVATSNRDIAPAIKCGALREDLYYRLNTVSVRLSPLRMRPDDIGPLATHFLNHFASLYEKDPPTITSTCMEQMKTYAWPGNARELENCMHRAFLMCMDGKLRPEHLELENMPGGIQETVMDLHEDTMTIRAGMSIRDMERALIRQTVTHVRGNRGEAAKLLGISIRTLRNKLHDMDAGTAFARTEPMQPDAQPNPQPSHAGALS